MAGSFAVDEFDDYSQEELNKILITVEKYVREAESNNAVGDNTAEESTESAEEKESVGPNHVGPETGKPVEFFLLFLPFFF